MHIEISGRRIDADSPPYIIAEAGVHHANSLELAKELILHARIAGADAVKFQTYEAHRLATKWARTYWDNALEATQFKIFAERSRLTQGDYAQLVDYSRELGIHFLSTPFHSEAAEFLSSLGMPAFKVASADLTHVPLLETVAGLGRPVLLSTGAATFQEIDGAVELLQARGAEFALLHCVLSYPTSIGDANLMRIEALRERYRQTLIGYSDHTQPSKTTLSCPIAVALGARIIEKHFTFNQELDGDDHYHAEDPSGLARLVRDCRDAYLLTRPGSEMRDAELPARKFARRSIVAARRLAAGERLTREHVDFKRPGTGLDPSRLPEILGRVLARDVEEDELIGPEQFVDASLNQAAER